MLLLAKSSYISSIALWVWTVLNNFFLYLDAMALSFWNDISNPVKALEIIGDITKFSLGPTLAFIWGREAFRREEKIRRKQEEEREAKEKATLLSIQEQEAEAVRTMLRIEIGANLRRISDLVKQYRFFLEVLPLEEVKVPFYISPHGLQTKAFDNQIAALAKSLKHNEKLEQVCQRYTEFRAIIYSYENLQPMVVEKMDMDEINQCKHVLLHLIQAQHLSNPLEENSSTG
ncbi:MAG: hypothetical protein F6K04_20355 [Leptolyngbya sp. SIO4C5]|nr:hypothetical protein [Leptolyngbya sp. SIO4C5]